MRRRLARIEATREIADRRENERIRRLQREHRRQTAQMNLAEYQAHLLTLSDDELLALIAPQEGDSVDLTKASDGLLQAVLDLAEGRITEEGIPPEIVEEADRLPAPEEWAVENPGAWLQRQAGGLP